MSETGVQSTGDEVVFPRVYRPSAVRRAVAWAVSVLLIAQTPLSIQYFFVEPKPDFATIGMLLCYIPAMLVVGLYILWWVLRVRVALWPDRIESREMTSSRTLMRNEIYGRRVWRAPNMPPQIALIPRCDNPNEFLINSSYKYDAVFRDWIESIPDLDAGETFRI